MSFLTTDRAEAQRAFVGLLAHPVVTPWGHPQTYVTLRRHFRRLDTWAQRLNYHLVQVDRSFRLRRVPLDGAVAAPAAETPPRVRLLYALYVAICLEQHRDDSISLQEISDLLGQFAGIGNRRPYDAKLRNHRQHLVGAVEVLTHHGVLERRTRQSLQDDWERSGEGIGAGFLLHRDALMLLVDTSDVDRALTRAPAPQDSRRATILRALVETQALYPGELDVDTHDYLIRQRGKIVHDVEEMTGGTVEVRADAWLLVLPSDRATPDECLIEFPGTTALDWACLAFIDELSPEATGNTGAFAVSTTHLEQVAQRLHGERARHLTVALRESPHALLSAVRERLSTVGLIRVEADGWRVLPIAGRYRAAELHLARPSTPEPDLFEGQ